MYIYETHMHTCEGSACGVTPGAEYPAFYKSIGFSGIIITDHFFHGNCRVPRDIPWEEFINQFCLGYENAKKAGDEIGFPVYFGWEESFEGDEFLVYGLDKEWLLSHPEMIHWTRTQHYDEIHKAGGLVVQAHPYRERDYLNAVRLNPETCDAWEGYNAFNEDPMNFRAVKRAKELGLFITAGSDFHRIGSKEPEGLFGMAFETPLTDIQDYVTRIQAHEGAPHVQAERSYPANENFTMETGLPLVVYHRE